ncbi:MAG: hypothetical protein E7163_01870 [Firmicutes bacterium]|nr:hypothetical protein [Bacillota bacterium]
MSINNFLINVANDIKYNNKIYKKDDFYYILKYLNINKDISLVSDIEKFYQDFLVSLNNSLIHYETRSLKNGENATHYIAFNTNSKANYKEAIKVYFPVKYKYMISALKTVFSYIIKNNIKATIKFHVKATNENIVIRFYDRNDLIPFINYCNNNFKLDELLEPLNPFITNKYGIGFVTDDNSISTYLDTLSLLLEEYFIVLRETDNYDNVSDVGFAEYLNKRLTIEENEEMKYNIESLLRCLNLLIKNKR